MLQDDAFKKNRTYLPMWKNMVEEVVHEGAKQAKIALGRLQESGIDAFKNLVVPANEVSLCKSFSVSSYAFITTKLVKYLQQKSGIRTGNVNSPHSIPWSSEVLSMYRTVNLHQPRTSLVFLQEDTNLAPLTTSQKLHLQSFLTSADVISDTNIFDLNQPVSSQPCGSSNSSSPS